MPSEIRKKLERAAGDTTPHGSFAEIWARSRRLRRTRMAMALTLSVLLLGPAWSAWAALVGSPENALPPAGRGMKTPVDEEYRDEAALAWPAPFIPQTTRSGDTEEIAVVFPDKTAARLSYPAELSLAAMGVQPTLSYVFPKAEPEAPFDIIFVHGDLPKRLLDPEPIRTFDTVTRPDPTLHRIEYRRLRGSTNFALRFDLEPWSILAVIPSADDAEVVAENLHLSVTNDGYPSVFATRPLELSRGFGEARGAHLEIGDLNPLFDYTDADDEFRYVEMAPLENCTDQPPAQIERDWYAARCLEFDSRGLAIFASINGPEAFVRAVYEGLQLKI